MNRSPSPAPRVISIIAIVFAAFALWISFGIYSRDMPLDRTPLLIGAIIVAAVEIVAAIMTLAGNPRGPRMFFLYALLAFVHVIADVAYLFAMPTRDRSGIGDYVTGTLGDAIGGLFHLAWCVACIAWPILVLVLAAPRHKRFAVQPPPRDPKMTDNDARVAHVV